MKRTAFLTALLTVRLLWPSWTFAPPPEIHGRRRLERRRTAVEAGKFALVGAGPGDPELLTLQAYRLIQDDQALVIADRLVSKEVLALVRGELRVAKKMPGCAEAAQEQIYDWIDEGLQENRTVIRLKIGDPFVFGRGGEEIRHVVHNGDGVESASVVPGVSAAISAPLAAGVPLTHRGVADKVLITTGFGRDGSEPDLPTFQSQTTLVMLMGVGRLGLVAETLVASKQFPPDHPVLVVEKATCHDQRVVIGDLTDIADIAKSNAIKPPATIVIGDVVNVLYPDQPHGIVHDASPVGLPRTSERLPHPLLDLLDAAAHKEAAEEVDAKPPHDVRLPQIRVFQNDSSSSSSRGSGGRPSSHNDTAVGVSSTS